MQPHKRSITAFREGFFKVKEGLKGKKFCGSLESSSHPLAQSWPFPIITLEPIFIKAFPQLDSVKSIFSLE